MTPSILFALWRRNTREVCLHGRTLQVGGESFSAGLNGQTIRMEQGAHGATLLLKNSNESLTLPGPPRHLLWVKAQLEALPALGSADDIPEFIRDLKRAKTSQDIV